MCVYLSLFWFLIVIDVVRYVLKLLVETKKFFDAEPTLVDFVFPDGGQVTVFGDIHGQFYDLLNIFSINGYPSEANPCVFNGDFVDRYDNPTVLELSKVFTLRYWTDLQG